ncbi:hypothetical protein HYZ05_00990 [Candidatus Daviesbacteria bacterium]|nr:hypothetical protein [Candidatus Daviesbacteria bacterium]
MVGKLKAQMSNVKSNLNFKKFVICHFGFVIHLLFVILILTLFTTPVFAQTSTPSPSSLQPTTYSLPPTIPPTSPLYTDLLVHNIFHTFSCLSIGSSVIGQPCLTYQLTQNAQGAIQSIPVLSSANLSGGLLGTTTGLIAGLYANPPIRTADYLASLGEGLGVVKEARAQVGGSGASVLSPILSLWQVSRNISYLVMIIIFVIIGLMVMFRQRINPQTVITAQAALPGLVIGLILITFSYFLAGFISDTAFIGTNAVGYYFAAAQGKLDDPQRTNLVQQISGDSVLSIFSEFVSIVTQEKAENAVIAIFDKLSGEVQGWLRLFTGFIAAQFVSPLTSAIPPPLGLWLGPLITAVAGGIVAATTQFWLGFILSFIAMIALIYAMLKLLLRLITAYLTIIFLTISAPFQFLAASLPGRQGIATNWVLNMLGNILIFPAVLAVFYFIAFILGKDFGPLKVVTDAVSPAGNNFMPVALAAEPIQIVGNTTFPLLGGMDLEFIKILLAFGALVALPKIPDIVVSAIGKMGQAGQLLGQEISGGIRSGQGYFAQGRGAVGGQLGGWNKALFGETSGPIWNPQHTQVLDKAGNFVGWKGGFSWPRRPGLIK